MINENKKRITVTLTNNVVADIDLLCEQLGLSKSQFISIAIGEKIFQYKTASNFLSQLTTELVKEQKK